MFTGIVQGRGMIDGVSSHSDGVRIAISTTELDLSDLVVGASVAVNGVCLTALDIGTHSFQAQLSAETLARSAGLDRRGAVNLERSLRVGDPLDGHWVLGHVDGIGEVVEVFAGVAEHRLRVRLPRDLARFCAVKGSIAVHGVSLTLNEVSEDEFAVNLIPHTAAVTTLGAVGVGDRLNIEVDPIARYCERLLAQRGVLR
jgi:riboflavin synthase